MGIDVKGLELIGQGHHGKVYRLDEKRCVKIYRKKGYLQMEYQVLKHSERFPYFPRVYECKDNYMIREYVEGPNLWEFLQENTLSKDLALKILGILDSFVDLGYSKLDIHLHHIIITKGERLKIIDPTTNMTRKATYPRVLLKQLQRLDLKDKFLEYTKAFRPDYYKKWIHQK